ncbi:MAG TPA: hypothetical protein VM118_06040 [Acidobacteriota bacterium]|nr:hypothetical protein [Acidobacteriota bacterium]
MKASKRVGVTAIALAIALFLTHCTEERCPVSQLPTDSVEVQGTVYAWRCSVGDWNNPFDPELSRFSVNTGEAATVTFIRDDGFTSVVETDDSSDFNLRLSAGAHKVVVETGYSFPPDTFYNIQLQPGDTTLVFDVVYCALDPLNITFVFSYPPQLDTMGMAAEWEVLNRLNQYTYRFGGGHPLLDITDVESPEPFHRVTGAHFSYYDLPVYRHHPIYGTPFNVCEAYELIQGVIDEDTTGLVPDHLYVYPTGNYMCKHNTSAPRGVPPTSDGASRLP